MRPLTHLLHCVSSAQVSCSELGPSIFPSTELRYSLNRTLPLSIAKHQASVDSSLLSSTELYLFRVRSIRLLPTLLHCFPQLNSPVHRFPQLSIRNSSCRVVSNSLVISAMTRHTTTNDSTNISQSRIYIYIYILEFYEFET